MIIHHSLSLTVILQAAQSRCNWATLHCNKETECTGLKRTLFPYVFKNRSLEALRASCLLRFNDYPVTPQRITASNWLLKLKIANHIHYLTSVCVILVINKAWHLPIASSKTPRKKYISEVRKAIYGESTVWAIIWDILHYQRCSIHQEYSPSHTTAQPASTISCSVWKGINCVVAVCKKCITIVAVV